MNSSETLPNLNPNAGPRYAVVSVYVMLAALTWVVFGQTLGHEFLAYDDQTYVYKNPQITNGITAHGVLAAFTDAHARNWHPITTISHMLDCRLFGLDPAGHHLVNVLLHAAAVLLLFSVLHAMTGALWRSAFVAAVFAIHPLRAESVAWIAERKDVLSGIFFMLTLAAYVHYVRSPSVKRYLCTVLVFTCGLMSKPMLVTMPLLLLLLDYWPLNRFSRQQLAWRSLAKISVFEKLPLLLLSVLSSAATLVVQKTTIDYGNQLPFMARLSNALISYIVYVRQMIWPARLAVFYPHTSEAAGFEAAFALVFISAITALAIALRRRAPYILVGWCWYLISLLPVIGLIQVGLQGHADRYTYLSQIGLAISLTWAAADLLKPISKRQEVLAGLGAVVIGLLTWRGWIQTSYWKSTQSLWSHVLAVAPDNAVANYNIAEQLCAHNRVDEAIAHYEKALNASSNNSASYCQLSPAIIHNGLGNALAEKGLFDEALLHYRKAVELQQDCADAHCNVAAMLVRRGELAEAITEYQRALEIPPEDAAGHVRLAALLSKTGRDDLAIAHYRRALQIAPDCVAALNAFAWILATNNHFDRRNGEDAVALAERANQCTGARNPFVLRTLAASYAKAGRLSDAIATAGRALALTDDCSLAELLTSAITNYRAEMHAPPFRPNWTTDASSASLNLAEF